MKRKIVLASKSFRRHELLRQVWITDFEICESEYEEDMCLGCDHVELAKILSLNKAKDVAKKYDDAIILSWDTFVVFDWKFIWKPKDEEDAFIMLKSFSWKELLAISGFSIIDTKQNKTINDYDIAKIKFKNLSNQEIWDYINSWDAMGKAWAFWIQSKAAVFIEKISWDFYSITAFPIHKIYNWLKEMWINILKN